jgi:hypothetical protein
VWRSIEPYIRNPIQKCKKNITQSVYATTIFSYQTLSYTETFKYPISAIFFSNLFRHIMENEKFATTQRIALRGGVTAEPIKVDVVVCCCYCCCSYINDFFFSNPTSVFMIQFFNLHITGVSLCRRVGCWMGIYAKHASASTKTQKCLFGAHGWNVFVCLIKKRMQRICHSDFSASTLQSGMWIQFLWYFPGARIWLLEIFVTFLCLFFDEFRIFRKFSWDWQFGLMISCEFLRIHVKSDYSSKKKTKFFGKMWCFFHNFQIKFSAPQ